MIVACLVAALTSTVAIFLLRRFAVPLGLVDYPNERKHHVGTVPLVGGAAMFTGTLAGALCYGQIHSFGLMLLVTASVLALLGVLDDRFDLSVRLRLMVQTIMILIIIATTGIYIHTLGHIFGYKVELGWVGIPLTVVAVIGLLNAFNMMDGIDGLAGGLALISIAAILLFAGVEPLSSLAALMVLLAAAVLPYLAANLGFMGHKIFMGDAGSMVIGYLLAWTLIYLSQEPGTHLSPVDVLWCVALPVLDTLAVMYRRIRQNKSPFKPDRGHIHHILQGLGLGSRATLAVLITLAAAMAFAGTVARSLGSGSGFNLAAFFTLMIVYVIAVTRIGEKLHAQRNSRGSVQTSNVVNITFTAKHLQKTHFEMHGTRETTMQKIGTDDSP
jgi:UDP-GlcNAc:undecaprenyl-phosphate GlcNAc-1-phosphate transferase